MQSLSAKASHAPARNSGKEQPEIQEIICENAARYLARTIGRTQGPGLSKHFPSFVNSRRNCCMVICEEREANYSIGVDISSEFFSISF